MHPKKYRSHSARPRGQNSTPWGLLPVETLPDLEEEPSKSENDHRVGAKKRTRSDQERCSTPPRRASKRTKKKPRKYSFEEEVSHFGKKEEEVATEFRGCVDPKNRGKRSVRPRGSKPASSTSWAMSLDGFQNLGAAASKLPDIGSERMKSTTGGILPRDVAKVEENSGAAVEQNNVALVDGLAEVVEGNGAGANRTDEQTSVAEANRTSLDAKDSNHGGDNAAAELKARNGAGANSVVHTGVLKESNVADALAKTDVQTDNDLDPLKDRSNGECDSKTFSGLDLVDGNVNFDLSSAESALASLYGESDRDICIEFAVKLLMNETPLPKEVAEIEEFFTQKIHGEKSAKRLRQEEPSNSCSVWGNLQSDKLLLTSRC